MINLYVWFDKGDPPKVKLAYEIGTFLCIVLSCAPRLNRHCRSGVFWRAFKQFVTVGHIN